MFLEFDLIMNKSKQNKVEFKTIEDKDVILENIKQTLSKLNADNYETVIFSLCNFKYDEELMSSLCELIFNRAISELHNMSMFGQLTIHLNEYFNVILSKNLFRKSMLHKCQEAFNDNNKNNLNVNSANEENLKKLRVMSNILFIGELFLRRMVADKLFVNCLDLLLDYSEESFETFLGLFKKVAYVLKDKKITKNEGCVIQYYLEAIKKQAASTKSKKILDLVDDIYVCNNRGFCDEKGLPLSNPEFIRNIDLGFLNKCLKDHDINKFLNKLGKRISEETIDNDKTDVPINFN